jgi:quercetin dioxygenase-like cupin family protein
MVSMARSQKIIDTSAVLGVKAFCQDVQPADLMDRPMTMEAEFAPRAVSTKHVHPQQEESFEVLSGTLDLFVDDRWKSLRPGESVRIPKGVVHAFRNSTETPARAVNTHAPGLRFQQYLERLERLIQQRKVTGMSGLRNGIYLSLLSMEYRREFVAVSPPDWMVRALAKVGRALGFKLT